MPRATTRPAPHASPAPPSGATAPPRPPEIPAEAPLVTFFRMIDQARLPERAERSAAGSLPTRAFRYCDAITTATGFGWYLFAPMDIELYFDGNEVFASLDGGEGFFPLSIIQFPDFAARFDAAAPDGIKGFSPPFLGCMQEPGIVQIWSGLTARTAPGWSVLVRPCANLPGNRGFEVFEGVIETDHWFGPLFMNLRLTRTHGPIRFGRDWPIAMVQVVPQAAYAEATLRQAETIDSLEAFAPSDWQAYADTVVRRCTQPVRTPGAYAVENRKRRKGQAPSEAAATTAGPHPAPGASACPYAAAAAGE